MPKIKPHPIIVRSDNSKPTLSAVSMALDEIVEVSVPFLGEMPDAETLPEITHKTIKCFAVYCDSIRWDGQEGTMNKSGDGSALRPYRNARYALQQILCTLEKTCFLPMFILYITGEVNYAVSHKALCGLKMFTDIWGNTHYTRLNERDFFRQRLIVSGEKAEGGKLRITPEMLNYDNANRTDDYFGSCYKGTVIYTSCIPQALLIKNIIFDHQYVCDCDVYTSGMFYNCEFINAGYEIGSASWAMDESDFLNCKFENTYVYASKIHSCQLTYARALKYCVSSEVVVANTGNWPPELKEMLWRVIESPIIHSCNVTITDCVVDAIGVDGNYLNIIACDCDYLVDTAISINIIPQTVQRISVVGVTSAYSRNSKIQITCDCRNLAFTTDVSGYRDMYCDLITGNSESPVPTILNFPNNFWQDGSFEYAHYSCITGTDDTCSKEGIREHWSIGSYDGFEYPVNHITDEYRKNTVNTTTCTISRTTGQKRCQEKIITVC